MPRNGSGVYNLPAGNPVVTGTVISSATQNSTMSDVAAALTQSLASDGQTPLLANLNANGNRITNLGSSASSTDAANRGDITSLIASTPPRGYIAGLTMSTAGSSTTFTVAPGSCADSTNAYMLTLASSMSKTTAPWVAGSGNGGLDGSSVSTNTFYHVYLIRRPDTGAVDVIFSLGPITPTLPTNYTQFRRIGSIRTNGSSQWASFAQNGDEFIWGGGPVADVNAANPGTAAVTRTLTVPTGVSVTAVLTVTVASNDSTSQASAYLSDLATSDVAVTTTNAQISSTYPGSGNTVTNAGEVRVQTNTSAQIRSRLNYSSATVTLLIGTKGWVDSRGRNA